MMTSSSSGLKSIGGRHWSVTFEGWGTRHIHLPDVGSQTCAVAPSPVATEPRRAAALRCRGRAGKSPLDLGSARFSNCQPACSDCSVTLALPALPTFLPTIWGSCSATAFLLIDARAYTTRRANQVSSRLHRAYLQPNKCDSGLKTTYLRFPGKAAKLREISLFHLILSSLCTAFASIAFPSIPPAARFPLVSFLGSSSFCWQPGTWHEHLFAITHDIPLRPQQLLTSCRRVHPKSYSQTKTVLLEGRNCTRNHPIALPCHSPLHQAAAGLQETSHRFSHTPPAYRSVHISSRIGS